MSRKQIQGTEFYRFILYSEMTNSRTTIAEWENSCILIMQEDVMEYAIPYRNRLQAARELLWAARMVLCSPGKRVTGLEFRTENAYNDYCGKYDIRDTTTVVVNGEIRRRGRDWLRLDIRDRSRLMKAVPSKSPYVIESRRRLPEYRRIRISNAPWHKHDGVSDLSPKKREEWREKCKADIEKLRPGLWQKAQNVYDRLDDVEKDVIRAYTWRDLYDINRDFFRIYSGRQKDLSEIQMWETQRRIRLLKKLPRFRGTLWRVMRFDSQDALDLFTDKWKRGESPMTGFISTTYVEERVQNYKGKEGEIPCVIRIVDSKNGRYIGHLSSTPKDEEALYSCNQRFRLVKDGETEFEPVEDKDGIRYITVKEENGNEKQ